MPSKQTDHRRAWQREWQRKRRASLLKASVVALLKAGAPPSQIGKPQTLRQQLRAMLRDREALKARIEWQSGGIKMLREQIATLEARLATLPAMEDTEARERERIGQQRLTLVEAELAALYASLPMQRAEAILDDQRRELLEEELSWGSGGQHEG